MLETLKPNKVFEYFEKICSIPHGSGNVKQISDYLLSFGQERGLYCRQDDALNVVIVKEATPGMEDKAPIIIQGHMDMVAVKDEDIQKDLTKEGLDLDIDGDYIYAKGTSLGGDDGIAVAYALALLDSDDIPHPRLEAVFTVDEEVGMDGAIAIDLSDLKGKKLVNIDSEKEGELTVACAGGGCVKGVFKPAYHEVEGLCYELSLSGLTGGHSGVEIHKGLANANKVLFQVLYLMAREADMTLISYEGGTKDNVIPSAAVCTFASRAEFEMLDGLVQIMEESLKEEWKETDPNLSLKLVALDTDTSKAKKGSPINLLGMDGNDFFDLLEFFNGVPNGVQKMNPSLEGLVQTSLNLGVVILEEGGKCQATFSVRSSVSAEKEELSKLLTDRIQEFGGKSEVYGGYPAWEYKEDSELRDDMVRIYREMFSKEPIVLSIHAGLECGVLSEKIEGLDCVSFGPDILQIHSTKERLSIASVQRMWDYLLEVIKA